MRCCQWEATKLDVALKLDHGVGTKGNLLFAKAINDEFQHRLAKRPDLAHQYPALITFYAQRRAKVAEGKRSKQALRAALSNSSQSAIAKE